MGRQELRAIVSADSRQFNRTMGKVKQAAAKTAGAIAGLGIVGITKATKQASEFNKSLAEVATLGAFTSSEMDGIGRSLLKLSTELGATTEELTGGLYEAISASVPKDNAIAFLETSVKAAKAGVTDTKTAVDGLTTILNAYGKDASEADAISDQFFQTVKQGKTNFEALASNIGKVASSASAAGVSTEQLFAAFATLTKQGISTEIATTRIQAAITALNAPSKSLSKVLKKLGFDSGEAAIRQLGFQKTLAAVSGAVGDNNVELQKLFPNVRAVGAVISLAGSKAALAAADLEGLKNATGAASSAFAIMNAEGAADFDKAMAGINAAAIQVGQKTLPLVSAEVANLNELLASTEGQQALSDLGDTAAGALAVIRLLVEGVTELGNLIATDEFQKAFKIARTVANPTSLVTDKIKEKFDPNKGVKEFIGSAITKEEAAAFREIKQSNGLLEGGRTVAAITQARVSEDFLRAGSSESVLILQNIQTTLANRLPPAVQGATE